ncbi:MAG: hypothetical protein ACYDDS_06655 [Candidatus Sulfotelmatobacter sp.]|jgi:hypothetical protein
MKMDYKWQDLYVAAVLETNRSKLPQLIAEAQAAIQARVSELSNDHMGTPEERMAIDSALGGLRILSEEVLESKLHSSAESANQR